MKLFRVVERQTILVEYTIRCENRDAWERADGSHEVLAREELDCLDCELVEFEEIGDD